MKLKIAFCSVLVILTFGLRAQVIFSEDFTAPFTSTTQGWKLYNNSTPTPGNAFWQGGVFTAYNGQPNDFARVSYSAVASGSGNISCWAITPKLNLENGTILQFATITESPIVHPDRLQIRMSLGLDSTIGLGSTAIGTFTQLLLDINPNLTTNSTSIAVGGIVNGYPTSWTVYTVGVTGLSGPTTGRFAFRYYVTNGGPTGVNSNNIGIDAVRVIKSPCNAVKQVTCGLTLNENLPGGDGYPGYPSVFAQRIYSITPLISGQYLLNINNTSIGSFDVYQGNNCSPGGWGTSIGSVASNSSSSFTVQLNVGSSYYFLLQDGDDAPNNLSINLNCPVVSGPCGALSNLECGVASNFTLPAGQGAWGSTQPGNEKIFIINTTITGIYTVNLSSIGAVTIYTSTTCSESGWSQLNTTSSNSYTFFALSGTTQYLLIDDNDLALTTGSCSIVCATPEACTLGNFGLSKASSPIDEDITNVSIGNLNNSSSCTQTVLGQNSVLRQYSNYTGVTDPPLLQQGREYQLSVSLGECGSGSCSDGGISVYIDYNGNGSFDKLTESAWEKEHCKVNATGGNTYTTNIIIPQGTPSGYKRMRVIFNCDGLTGPTDSYIYGETEDYCVEVRTVITSINGEGMIQSPISVYPNPTTGEVFVQLEKSNGYKIVLTTILGQVVLTQEAENNIVDLSKMANGLYFLTVLDQNNIVYKTRIVKQ